MPGVLEVIAARRSGARDDHVLALALEGGGMRGIVSGAVLVALRDLGLHRLFDRFYGTSSGSVNLAYFAAGHGWDALAAYYDHLATGFVRRPRPGRPALDMARLRRVLTTDLPLSDAAVTGSEFDVRILQTDVERCAPVVIPLRERPGAVVENLLAGAWLPILAGRPYPLDGRPHLDGGLLWPDPLYGALAEGCSHVLVINTAPAGRPAGTPVVSSRVLARVLDRWSPGLGAGYLAGRRRWDRDRPRLVAGRETTVDGAAVVRLQPPPGDHAVHRLTTDPGTLLFGARSGYRTLSAAVGGPAGDSWFTVTRG